MKPKLRYLGTAMLAVTTLWLTALPAPAQIGSGTALSFDGVDDYVSVSPNTALDITTGTIEFWVNRGALVGNACIIANRSSIWSTRYSAHMSTTSIGLWNGRSYRTVLFASTAGQWYHVALVCSSERTEVFVDGLSQGFTRDDDIPTHTINPDFSGMPFSIGVAWNHSGSPYEHFVGQIDEVRVWDITRSQAEIQANMNQPLTGTESGLVAYYPFSEGAGTTTADATGNGLTGTLLNGTSWTAGVTVELVADAGPDQAVSETPWHLPLVLLNGCSSIVEGTSPEDLTFQWTQVAGPSVALSDPAICDPTFTAPLLPAQTVQVLTFKLVVGDGQLTSEDFVDITVNNNNHAPVCGVPDPFEVAEGSPGVQLDGSASYDPDDDTLTYSWVQAEGPQSISLSGANTATASFDAPWILGGGGDTLVDEAYLFTLTISDGQLASSCDVIVVVNNLNHCPTADAGQNQMVAEGEPCSLTGAASSDPDNDLLLCAWQQTYGPAVTLDDPSSFTPSFVAPWVDAGGADLTFVLTVDDQYGCTDTATVTVHVDNVGDPPTCVGARASKAELWPPNHKMVEIGIENIGTGNLPTTIAITGVMQDEPSNGLGDGDTACDAVISEDATTVMLRVERAGSGNGRVYHVAFTATNDQGSCSGVVQVSVPLNRKKGQVAVDDGPLYPSCP